MAFSNIVSDALNQVGNDLAFDGGTSVNLPHLPNLAQGKIYPLKIGSYEFKDECLIQIKGAKDLILTKIPGGNGTVKELSSQPDYEVNITGRLVHKNNADMLQEINNLIALYNIEDSLDIICPYTDSFGISQIVIQDFEPIVRKGYQSVLWFTLNCLSNNEVSRSTIIKQNKNNLLNQLLGA